jgi:ATP-dependent Zn protease
MRFRATAVVLALLPLFNSVAETIAFQNCLAPTRTTLAVRPSAQTARSYRQDFPLFSSSNLLPPSGDKKDEDPPRKRDVVRALWRAAVGRLQFLQAFASTAVKNLVGHAKFKAAIIYFVSFLLFLNVAKDHFPSSTHTPLSPTRAPIEVPYSKFMDYCEGTDVWVYIDNVKVDRGKLGYRVFRAETRSQRAVLKRMKQQHGAGHKYDNIITPEDMARLPQTHAYTHTVDVNNELVQFMRNNKVAFQANSASVDKNTSGWGLVPAAIIFVWSIFNRSSSSSSKGPGKMAKKNKGNVKMPSFDDIRGIDDAKRDVMELVDTLRNPEKYSLVGARAPTGLLLEGPPGTGKVRMDSLYLIFIFWNEKAHGMYFLFNSPIV